MISEEDGGLASTRTWDQGEFSVAIFQPLAAPDSEIPGKVSCKSVHSMQSTVISFT